MNHDVCWCCQKNLPVRETDRVVISVEITLPVCRHCWLRIPPAEQVRIAMLAQDRHNAPLGIGHLVESVQETVGAATTNALRMHFAHPLANKG